MYSVRSCWLPRFLCGRLPAIVFCVFVSISPTSEAGTRYSANVVGFSRVSVPPSNKQALVGMSFKPFDATLAGVLGTNQLRAAGSYSNADQVIFWDTVSKQYRSYALKTNDYQFHGCLNESEWNGPATNPPLTNGVGFWLLSPTGAASSISVTFMGEVVGTSTQQIAITNSLQLICYPFSAELNLVDADFKNDGASKGKNVNGGYAKADQIAVWTPVPGSYTTVALKTNDNWYYISSWTGGAPVTDMVFTLSRGFWYIHYTGGAPFVWSETNRYLDNL